MTQDQPGNLWLAQELWDLDAVEFGDFTLGRSTVGSPIYVNLRRLISNPSALRRVAQIIHEQLAALMSMRHPQVEPFSVVAGVPFGGLHVATAFSLEVSTPMIYLHPSGTAKEDLIEGRYVEGQTCLVIDDLITSGGSIVETTAKLREAGLIVRDAVAVIDRQEGGTDRLKAIGVNLHSVLQLKQLARYLRAESLIGDEQYSDVIDYLDRRKPAD
jgi:orotate phosphoribosyltransferase/uridine monophosphate synthetase